jgi:hypothetical protein
MTVVIMLMISIFTMLGRPPPLPDPAISSRHTQHQVIPPTGPLQLKLTGALCLYSRCTRLARATWRWPASGSRPSAAPPESSRSGYVQTPPHRLGITHHYHISRLMPSPLPSLSSSRSATPSIASAVHCPLQPITPSSYPVPTSMSFLFPTPLRLTILVQEVMVESEEGGGAPVIKYVSDRDDTQLLMQTSRLATGKPRVSAIVSPTPCRGPSPSRPPIRSALCPPHHPCPLKTQRHDSERDLSIDRYSDTLWICIIYPGDGGFGPPLTRDVPPQPPASAPINSDKRVRDSACFS